MLLQSLLVAEYCECCSAMVLVVLGALMADDDGTITTWRMIFAVLLKV